jgi:hypothetical protein
MNRCHAISIAAVLLAASTLSGCSGEPSSADIDRAVRLNVEQSNKQTKKAGIVLEVHEVKKVACAAAQGSAGFNCDIELDATVPIAGRSKGVKKVRFVKASDGWQVAQ